MKIKVNVGAMHIKRSAQWFADRTAVIDGNKRLTYREFNRRINRFANGLLKLGIQKGERVAFFSHNRHQLLEGLYACYKSGFVAVPLNWRISLQELIYMLNNSDAVALILGPEFVDLIRANLSEFSGVRHFIATGDAPAEMLDFEKISETGSPEEPDTETFPEDLISLNYTSGTSGKLKAAMITHKNRLCLGEKFLLSAQGTINKNTVICHSGPVTHASGGIVLPVVISGGCNLLLREFDVKTLLRTIQDEKVTHIFTVPTMLNFLMAYPDLKKYDLSSLQSIIYGASPMPPAQIKRALDIFGPILSQGYGQTETTSGITTLSREDHVVGDDPVKIRRLASAGRPGFKSDVRVVDENGGEVKPGEIGEIVERGDDTMLGYWKDPEATAASLIDGWMYTRDMATVDEGGYIYIVDRKSDMIISGGFNIYPTEVENVLYRHPAVFEAAVVPVPDDQWGESVKAVVVLKPGASATEQELIEFCKTNLAGYKKPKSVDFVKELPKSPVGKILRRKVKEPFWKDRARQVN
jgi:acyl-CoA synthetase (AMP-forming)/AMP-acid ligase II